MERETPLERGDMAVPTGILDLMSRTVVEESPRAGQASG
jgi:hypothetical protein